MNTVSCKGSVIIPTLLIGTGTETTLRGSVASLLMTLLKLF